MNFIVYDNIFHRYMKTAMAAKKTTVKKADTKKYAEKDLFGPIKEYFEKKGYVCDGEVMDIDLYMEKDGMSTAVELKLTLDFKAVQQAALRQKVTDAVYIGIFCPKDMRSRSFTDKLYLLKRLGIGLITVTKRTKTVSIANEPVVCELSTFRTRNARRSAAVSKEFNKRKTKLNTGGVSGTKLITGYREEALIVLDALCSLGSESDTHSIHAASGIEKTAAILRANYYRWFEKKGSGRYCISDAGYAALEEFEPVLKALMRPGK